MYPNRASQFSIGIRESRLIKKVPFLCKITVKAPSQFSIGFRISRLIEKEWLSKMIEVQNVMYQTFVQFY
jgi:hypothetical protein